MKKLGFSLIGISGFGKSHLDTAERLMKEGLVELKAVCDVNYEANRDIIEKLEKEGVKYYSDYREMLQKEKTVDFVSISTPLHLHRKMSIDAMEAGFHVLLEKPPAVTIQDVDEIIKASEQKGRHCAIDFVLTSQTSFLELKKLVRGGELGEILNITGIGKIVRDSAYFGRNQWAGKLAVNGNYVLDGPINNPLAHLLNNMVLLGAEKGSGTGGKAEIVSARAELYHGNDIESEDTSCIHAKMDNGVNLYFYVTLCCNKFETPRIIVEGTKGTAIWHYSNGLDVDSGEVKLNLRPDRENGVDNIYRNLCEVINGEKEELYCSVKDTRNFVLASNGAFESSGTVHKVPEEYISHVSNGEAVEVHIKDIGEIMERAAAEKKLFSEIGVEWAKPGKEFSLKDYKNFALFLPKG